MCQCAKAQACEVKVFNQLARQFELMRLGTNEAPAGRECCIRRVFNSEFKVAGPQLELMMGPPPTRPSKRLKCDVTDGVLS